MFQPEDFQIRHLGPCKLDARQFGTLENLTAEDFWVSEEERVPFKVTFRRGECPDWELSFERAGARDRLYFDPTKVTAGIVTCGGICPGLNDVIRALFMELYHVYGTRKILGFRFGLRGLNPASGLPPTRLTRDLVENIHTIGGSILGTSRGFVEPGIIAENLGRSGVNQLFVVGGDGTQRAAHAIWQAAERIGYPLAVVGVPKTIDNDINFVYKTFGFDSAVSFAKTALDAAHIEAKGNPNGIGLVKVMGRDSGFIAAYATLASINVNFTLIPEVAFQLDGPGALLDVLEKRIRKRGHAVIVVAEGAGQDLFKNQARAIDASGNVKHADIGVYLKERIVEHFKQKKIEMNLKYIDPSYMLRSLPSNATDSIFAADLARYAVHAAMAGKTDVMIGRRFNQFIHVPIPLATIERKKIDPREALWMSVLQATGQPANLLAR